MKFQRNTRQRQVILEELQRLRSHPTAQELYEITRRRIPKISLGTVYRNLELLTKMGLARKVKTNGSETRFDGNLDHHYHVRCTHCEKIHDLHDLPSDLVGRDLQTIDGFEILDYHLEFIGVCPDCRKERSQKVGLGLNEY